MNSEQARCVTHRFDLLVLGSGPAGSAAAITAARAGLSVALIDKAAFPRDKLCGGLITGRTVRYMDGIFGLPVLPHLFRPSTRFRLTYQGRVIGRDDDAPALQMTMRRDFDAELHARAQAAGVTVFAPVRVTSIDTEAPGLMLSDGRTLSGRVLIGADGANSAVARALFGRAYDPAEIGFGLEVELDRAEMPDDDTTEVDLGAALWGYGWVFPKHGSVTLGVGGGHAQNPDMKAHFRAYLTQHAPHIAPDRVKCKGAFLPFGAYRKTPGRGAVLLAGDAAGLVDPITGEGIAWAMKSGEFAGQAAAEAIRQDRPAMEAYMARLGYIHREMAAARRIRTLIYAPIIRRHFPRVVERNPSMTRSYLRLLSGQIDYADLGSRVLWRTARRFVTAMLPHGR